MFNSEVYCSFAELKVVCALQEEGFSYEEIREGVQFKPSSTREDLSTVRGVLLLLRR